MSSYRSWNAATEARIGMPARLSCDLAPTSTSFTFSGPKLLTLETGVAKTRMRSILHYNGLPLAASYVIDGIMAAVQERAPPAVQRVRT